MQSQYRALHYSASRGKKQLINETREKLLIILNDHVYCRSPEKKSMQVPVVPDFDLYGRLYAVTDTTEQLHSDQSSMVAACAVDTHDVVCHRP